MAPTPTPPVSVLVLSPALCCPPLRPKFRLSSRKDGAATADEDGLPTLFSPACLRWDFSLDAASCAVREAQPVLLEPYGHTFALLKASRRTLIWRVSGVSPDMGSLVFLRVNKKTQCGEYQALPHPAFFAFISRYFLSYSLVEFRCGFECLDDCGACECNLWYSCHVAVSCRKSIFSSTALSVLLKGSPKMMAPYLEHVILPVWGTLTAAAKKYVTEVVNQASVQHTYAACPCMIPIVLIHIDISPSSFRAGRTTMSSWIRTGRSSASRTSSTPSSRSYTSSWNRPSKFSCHKLENSNFIFFLCCLLAQVPSSSTKGPVRHHVLRRTLHANHGRTGTLGRIPLSFKQILIFTPFSD